MDMPSKKVYEILNDNDVGELHHANSLATACQFLRSKCLMARGSVERLGLAQTPQDSDSSDKRFGIWFDVFVDSVDIHARAQRANVYGPVMFVLDSEVLTRSYTGRIWVTKRNPIYWSGRPDSERWFQGVEDLGGSFQKGRFGQMIVLRHCGGSLPFGSSLQRIVLDDPQIETDEGVDFYSMAIGALRLAQQDAGLDIPIVKRKCSPACTCVQNWAQDEERLYGMFDPKVT